MKKLILVAVLTILLASLATPALARSHTPSCDGPFGSILNKCVVHPKPAEPIKSQLVVGVKLDAPNLIRFTENLTLGLEAGKDMYSDPFRDRGFMLEDDEGYFGYVKITYAGSLLDFSKK